MSIYDIQDSMITLVRYKSTSSPRAQKIKCMNQ